MKILLTVTIMLFIVVNIDGQSNKYLFTFDNAGNRIGTSVTLKSAQVGSLPDSTFMKEEYNATFENLALKIYPNPTKGRIDLEIKQFKEDLGISVHILDASGNKLGAKKIVSDLTPIDLTPYAPGIFFLKLTCGENQRTLKVIKQ